jgi:hypothetical protein
MAKKSHNLVTLMVSHAERRSFCESRNNVCTYGPVCTHRLAKWKQDLIRFFFIAVCLIYCLSPSSTPRINDVKQALDRRRSQIYRSLKFQAAVAA